MSCENQEGFYYGVCHASKTDKERDQTINTVLKNMITPRRLSNEFRTFVEEIIKDGGKCHSHREECPHIKNNKE